MEREEYTIIPIRNPTPKSKDIMFPAHTSNPIIHLAKPSGLSLSHLYSIRKAKSQTPNAISMQKTNYVQLATSAVLAHRYASDFLSCC